MLQRWLYCREHLKYVWNVYCVVTNHMRVLHTTETTGHERFPSGHGTNYFRFVSTFSFFYRQTTTFPSHLFYSMCYNSEEYGFKRFWNKLQSRCARRDACDGSKLLYNDGNRSLKISKISVSLACYWQIGSKYTNHSPIAWRREGYKVTLVAAIGGFRSDLSMTRTTEGNFGNLSVSFFKDRFRWLQ